MPVPTPPTTPSSPPVAPQRTEPTTFSARMDAWLAWFNSSFWSWIYNVVPWIQARANEVEAWSNSASASATAAGVSQTVAAEATATATAAITTVTQQAQAAAANSATISSVAAAASTSASAASASSAAAASYRDQAVQAWAAASAPGERLASISKSLHSGAIVKSVIYDTSKDSDGGAWRKRTQTTSWYTEALGGEVWIGQQASEAVARAYVGSLASPNLVTNGTFTTDTGGWTAGNSATLSVVASRLRVTNTVALNGRASQAITTVVGKSYSVSAEQTIGTATTWYLYAGTTAGNNDVAGNTVSTSVASSNLTFVATSTTTHISLIINATSGQYADFDNISVKLVDSAIDPANTVYQSTADGKFYRTNGNLLPDTNLFFNQWSTDSVATRNSVSVTAPDGSATVIQLVSSAGGAPYVYSNPVLVSGTIYTYSMYVKLGTGGNGTVRLANTTSNANATFNLSTGTVGATTNATSTIVSIGNGWYRCSMTYTATASAANTSDIALLGTFTTGQGHYIWGAQLELGSTALSYKPVTTTYVGSQTEVFRGISGEFPAVVAIVAEASRVVIYDLTVSSCPMWMVFVASNGGTLYNGGLTTVAALNGQLVVGSTLHLAQADFTSDYTRFRNSDGNLYNANRITNRNSATGPVQSGPIPAIVNQAVNDVAITTLDTAPTDPATGLPGPTIAVATAGGVSVIKDDGTVASLTLTSNSATSVSIVGDRFAYSISNSGRYIAEYSLRAMTSHTIATLDATDSQRLAMYAPTTALSIPTVSAGGPTGALVTCSNSTVAVGGPSALNLLRRNPTTQAAGMVNYITNTYNSGWLPGDIRGAYLSDTTAETIAATDIGWPSASLTVASFTGAGLASWDITDGGDRIRITRNASAYAGVPVITGSTYVSGASYRFLFNILTISAGARAHYTATNGGAGRLIVNTYPSAAGLYEENASPTNQGSNKPVIGICAARPSSPANALAGDYIEVSKTLSIQFTQQDRSVKNKGLVINGTLTKSAVASGAGLVAYSGFSASNYLEQSYSANLDFGTGDFCVMGWANPANSTGNQRLLDKSDGTTTGQLGLYFSSGQLAVTIGVGGAFLTGGLVYPNASWSFIVVLRISGQVYTYANGALVNTTSASQTVSNASSKTRLGLNYSGSEAFAGSLALWRISATAPSADQIAHIYRTELPLFQANAQCTIAGTSTAVTALAYDDVADELHVGTSWGRSEFRDLLRVASEATTTGAITSLSANEGVVFTGGASSGKVYAPALYLRDELRRKDVARKALGRIPAFFDYTATASQTAFVAPKGFTVKALYKNGTLMRETTTGVYWTSSNDGFQETATLSVGATVSDWISLMCVRA